MAGMVFEQNFVNNFVSSFVFIVCGTVIKSWCTRSVSVKFIGVRTLKVSSER